MSIGSWKKSKFVVNNMEIHGRGGIIKRSNVNGRKVEYDRNSIEKQSQGRFQI